MNTALVFVNLKRFDVPRDRGGVCPDTDPKRWIQGVMRRSVDLGLGRNPGLRLVYLAPEALILPAVEALGAHSGIDVGCQGVFREDVTHGGNFGAFTTNLPAAAAANLGCRWSIIGHSEERKDKTQILQAYDPAVVAEPEAERRAAEAVGRLMNAEVLRALEATLDVLVCLGESAAERGGGSFEEQAPRVQAVLQGQVRIALQRVSAHLPGRRLVIGYEPVWAIGPGKTPPGGEYIDFVAGIVKSAAHSEFALEVPVVYGGGLKRENAAEVGRAANVDGGLVALTRFTPPVGFDPEELARIVEAYLQGKERGR